MLLLAFILTFVDLKLTKLLRSFINRTIPITRIKIFIAKILYSGVIIFYGKKKRLIKRNEINFEVDLSEGIDLSLFLFGNYQRHVTRSKLLYLSNDAIIIDVGANFGVMTLQFALASSRGKVYSFEPALPILEKLKKNLTLNPGLASRITVFNSFVSAKSQKDPGIKAYASWKLDSTANTIDEHPDHLGTQLPTDGVPAISLDDFCLNEQISKLDFIKIDTDGHEYEVLLGAKVCIKKYRPQLIFEISIYAMIEKNIDFSFYSNYFNELNYSLHNSANGKLITVKNYRNHIPRKGTIDIIAIPAAVK